MTELEDQIKRIHQAHQKIRGKLFSRKSPNYNTYVRLFGRDIVTYFLELETLLDLIIQHIGDTDIDD